MEPFELAGTYSYRSFLNGPASGAGSRELERPEAELSLFVTLDGKISGSLSWPLQPDDAERAVVRLQGDMASREPLMIRLRGSGPQGSKSEKLDHLFLFTSAGPFEGTGEQPLCLVGSVMRAAEEGDPKASASIVAVKQAFREPRDIPGVALAPSTVAMMASKRHRLWHATWHTARSEWINLRRETSRRRIAELGWEIRRPPRRRRADGSALVLDNGAGEDFLFMHRAMIGMVRDDCRMQGIEPPAAWKTLPRPDAEQVVYSPVEGDGGVTEFRRNAALSGNMVLATKDWAKTPDFFTSVVKNWESHFTSAATLEALSLGALGVLMEFTIHNAMHRRWCSLARDPETGEALRDPETGEPDIRPSFDFSDKWDSPRYDYLGEFYSSQLNPVFWRMHGWVDARVEDWARVHEAARPGAVRRRQLHGVDWFVPDPPWVSVAEPFTGLPLTSGPHMRQAADEAAEIDAMLKVMAAIEEDAREPVAGERRRPGERPPRVSMRFTLPGEE